MDAVEGEFTTWAYHSATLRRLCASIQDGLYSSYNELEQVKTNAASGAILVPQ
jgi:hypothetical protein